MTGRRLATGVLLLLVWFGLGSGAAIADPPGPTDYLSEVVAIEPDPGGIHVEIVGGDSFVLLEVDRGVRVDVVGYSGEPYLRFLPDGTVEENQLSPSRYLNEDRFGISDVPDEAVKDAVPEWKVVAGDGSYAWHDHRTHWMNRVRPPGRGPGDQVAEGVIPLFVDGAEVDVTVVSIWQPPPSALPIVLGITAGIFLSYAMIKARGRSIERVLVVVSLAALISGGVAYFSVPLETGPAMTLWALPATALALVLLATVRSSLQTTTHTMLVLVAALELVAWTTAHWSWLWSAILPTLLPGWLDRMIGAGVLVAGTGAALAVLLSVARPRQIRPRFRPR